MKKEDYFTQAKRRELMLAALEDSLISGNAGDDGLGLYIDARRRQYRQEMNKELSEYWNE